MHKITLSSLNELKNWVGKQLPPSDWQEITQQRIDLFAEAGGDKIEKIEKINGGGAAA